MKKVKTVGITSLLLIVAAIVLLACVTPLSEAAQHKALVENGGVIGTQILETVARQTEAFYRGIASIIAALGIGGVLISANKWLNL
ncbi:MAG: hypothetical protein PWP51_2385 [Clostridiales bacterium]|jgi:hypothetical protein|nr:hypothetical protein [Clostridiales bacterium]MDN5299832.1 hypothetical protein [Clostridiales bacterium]